MEEQVLSLAHVDARLGDSICGLREGGLGVEGVDQGAQHGFLGETGALEPGENGRLQLAALQHGMHAALEFTQLFRMGAQLLHEGVKFVARRAMDVEALQVARLHDVALQSLQVLGDLVTLAGLHRLLGVFRPLPGGVGHATRGVNARPLRQVGEIGHAGIDRPALLVDQLSGRLLVPLRPGIGPRAVEPLGGIGRNRSGGSSVTEFR